MDAPPSSSKDTTAVAPKLNEEQTDTDKVPKKFVLPPEYDANDSRWTLKYREPAQGVVELMKHSAVYVDADKIIECEKRSNDCKAFARMLLTEIFTTSALRICSWTSETTNASDIHSGRARPGLDEHAKETLLMYVNQFGVCQNWNITDYQCCVNGMRQLMLEMRRDRHREENYFDELMEKFSLTHFRQTMLEMICGLQKEEEDVRDKLLGEGSQTRNWSLPPEDYENDSRWTLKYLEPAPGLVELMPQSGVFVNADKLTLRVLFSKNCVTLARKLLDEIFTTSALQMCSWTGPIAEDSDHGGKNARPGLNENAMQTLLNFVAEFELENNLLIKTKSKYTVNMLKHVEKKEHTSNYWYGWLFRHVAVALANLEEESELKKSYAITERKDIRKYLLPKEYDENDSRWTLKYREPAPGLVELREHSGVYVNALRLASCERLSRDSKTLARMLLAEIFTRTALSTCSWTGARAKAFDQNRENVRPGLDEQARTVLLNYVADRAKMEGWNNYENQTILNGMRNKLQEMRFKYL